MCRENSYERDKRGRVPPREFDHGTVDLWAWVFDLNIIFIFKKKYRNSLQLLKNPGSLIFFWNLMLRKQKHMSKEKLRLCGIRAAA